MRKKIKTLLLALVMLVLLMPMKASAEETASGSCGSNATWTLENGVLTISGTGKIEGTRNIISVKVPWESYVDQITSIVINEGITGIGDQVFKDCVNLQSVQIPNSVTSIGYFSFYNCSGLSLIHIPDSVTQIVNSAFVGCSSLNRIVFEGNVPTMGDEILGNWINAVFLGINATAFYPNNNETWTEDVKQNYGGTITWVGYNEGETPWNCVIKDNGRTLSLSGVIYINQYVNLEGCEDVDLTKDAGLLIWKNEVTAPNALFGTEDILKTGLKASGSEYVQQSHGIAAKEYGDTIYLRVYVKAGEGTYVYGPLTQYSVRTYCDKVFANPDQAGEKLVNTCAAMLHYGAAAQNNFNYKTDNLANANMEYAAAEWNPEWINATAPFTTNIVASEKVTDTGRTLSLEGAIEMNCYYIFPGAVKKAELLVWDGVAAELTAENVSYTVDMTLKGSEYFGRPKAFAAKEYDKTIYVCARFVEEDGSVHYSDVKAYHPEQYAANVLASDKTSDQLKETVKAMVTYGQFAGIYFGTK